MVQTKENGDATPAKPPPSLKKQSSSASANKNQASILGFFSRSSANGTPTASNGILKPNNSGKGVNAMAKPTTTLKKPAFNKTAVKNMTPVPSSDVIEPPSSQENENGGISADEVDDARLPSPPTPAKRVKKEEVNGSALILGSSPSRKVRLQHVFNLIYKVNIISYSRRRR